MDGQNESALASVKHVSQTEIRPTIQVNSAQYNMAKSQPGVRETESDKQDDDLARESEPEIDNDSNKSDRPLDTGVARSSSVSSNEAQDNVGDDPLDVSKMRQVFKRQSTLCPTKPSIRHVHTQTNHSGPVGTMMGSDYEPLSATMRPVPPGEDPRNKLASDTPIIQFAYNQAKYSQLGEGPNSPDKDLDSTLKLGKKSLKYSILHKDTKMIRKGKLAKGNSLSTRKQNERDQ